MLADTQITNTILDSPSTKTGKETITVADITINYRLFDIIMVDNCIKLLQAAHSQSRGWQTPPDNDHLRP